MDVIEVNEGNFDSEVKGSNKTVLVDFFATWCAPCSAMAPVVKEIADEYPEYKCCKVNVDSSPSLANNFNVMSIPTFIVFKGGVISEQYTGATSKDALLSMLEEAK